MTRCEVEVRARELRADLEVERERRRAARRTSRVLACAAALIYVRGAQGGAR